MLYGVAFKHRPLSVFADGKAVRAPNPLMRVPVLVPKDGTALADSHMMQHHLDAPMAEPLFPRQTPRPPPGAADRHAWLWSGGKGGQTVLRTPPAHRDLAAGGARCALQKGSVMVGQDHHRRDRPGPWRFGHRLCPAAIAVTCAPRRAAHAHPHLPPLPRALVRPAAMLEALPEFRPTVQLQAHRAAVRRARLINPATAAPRPEQSGRSSPPHNPPRSAPAPRRRPPPPHRCASRRATARAAP